MRKIDVGKIRAAVAKLAIEANFVLRRDIIRAIRKAYISEKNRRAKKILRILLDNAEIARSEKIAICLKKLWFDLSEF